MSGASPDNPPVLINADGSSFSGELGGLQASLSALPNEARTEYRGSNAAAIAQDVSPHLLVVAGPGSGKSFLFLDRIRYWLSQEANAQIYVSSFVRKLVNDLKNEINTQIGDEGGQNVTATTLHTLARSLIERNRGAGDLQLRQNVQVIAGPWEGLVWEDVLAFHPDLSGYSLEAFRTQFFDDDLLEGPEWVDLRGIFDTLRLFYNAVGFPDMIVTARLAVEENPNLIQHSFWIIDEFQDFNTAEERLIKAVTRDASAVLLAGDDEQALYQQLKRSHPEIIVSYYDDPAFANAMLPYCSRCSYHVCLVASAFIARNRAGDAIAKIYLPLVEDPGALKVQVVAAPMPTTAVDYIRQFLERHSAELEEHAAAMEAGEETDPFLLILTPQGQVRFYKSRAADEELRELVKEWSNPAISHSRDYWKLADYFAVSKDPSNNFGLRKVLFHEKVDGAAVHELLVQAIAEATTLAALETELIASALRKCSEIAETLGSKELVASDKVARCAEVVSIAHQDRLATELEADPISGTTDEGNEEIETGGGGSPVELMTIVGAKGLSAKHVVVLGCDDLNLAHVTPLAFYVALTRARESLHLLVAAKAGGGKAPHDFLSDLPEEHCDFVVHKKSGSPEQVTDCRALHEKCATWDWAAKKGSKR